MLLPSPIRAERGLLAPAALVLCLLAAIAFWAGLAPRLFAADAQLRDGTGQVYGHDFAQFWTAGRLAFEESPASVWQADRFSAAIVKNFPGKEVTETTRFHYPPPVLVPLAAFGAMPLTLAFPLMSLGGLALLVFALWRIMPGWRTVLSVLGAPVVLNALVYGQWSLWLAALLALALMPIARGGAPQSVAVSLFIMKPTLGLALPLGFLLLPIGGRAMALTLCWTFALIALTTALFGTESWHAYFAALPESRALLMDRLDVFLMQSTTLGSALQALGVSPARARLLQWVFTSGVLLAAAIIMHGKARPDLKAATLAAATVLAAPYCMVYDLALLVPAGAFFIRDGMAHGFKRGDQIAIAAGAVLPYFATDLQNATGLPVGFMIALSAFVFTASRAIASAAEHERRAERDEEKSDRMIPAERLLHHEH